MLILFHHSKIQKPDPYSSQLQYILRVALGNIMADGWCYKMTSSGFDFYISENGMNLKGLTFRELHKKTMSHLNEDYSNGNAERWRIHLEKLPSKILCELVKDIETYFCTHYLEELYREKSIPSADLEKYFFLIKELISTGGHPCRWSLYEHFMEDGSEEV